MREHRCCFFTGRTDEAYRRKANKVARHYGYRIVCVDNPQGGPRGCFSGPSGEFDSYTAWAIEHDLKEAGLWPVEGNSTTEDAK